MLTLSQPESSNSSSFDNTHPSNSSSSNYSYHVFLSFRGPDTRYGFTGHLYKALSDKGVHTFMDDEELRKGEEITPALLKAIEGSRIAIVVLSKNYASSAFCLQELVKILECVKQEGRLVLPIFCGVNPSDVRHLNGSYGEAFIKHETRFQNDKEKVKKWKQALHDVSNLSGWHLQGFEYEYAFIKKIVEELSRKTHRFILHVAKHPVGLESQVEKLRSLLDIESNKKIIMVGIYGIGGVGKSTIARALYNLIADQFEGVCFLANVRERSEGSVGSVQLQEQLLSELAEENIKLSDVHMGIPLIKQRLGKKKVLLILDDVNKLCQLENLAGGLDWFGLGSRIFITTRDEDLLDTHGVKRKYLVKTLNNEEALKLLTWSAFKSDRIDASFQGILNKFLRYCNGLPLALEVIGSNLFGKGLSQWESMLDKYNKFPNGDIHKVLKVSYDSLEVDEKQIFLDIACFFDGCNLKYVEDILQKGRGYPTQCCVGVLIKRSLIVIDNGIVTIHDLIRDMGREIVKLESPSNPGERSRLWYYEDILEVFEENKGTDKIQVIMFNASRDRTVHWDGNELERMKNLRILIIKNAQFSCEPKHLPTSLRILDWEQYPSSFLPSDFKPRNLAILNLNRSCLTMLGQPFQRFESLSEINLSYFTLDRLPSLAGAPNLRNIILDECTNLIEVDGSIGLLDKLERLSARDCTNLAIFPEEIHSTSLLMLDLSGCLGLPNFPVMSGITRRIISLYLSGGGWGTALSLHGDTLKSETLMFPKLDKIIKGSSPVTALNVTKLIINYVNLKERFPSEWFPCFPNLQGLRLSHSYEVDQFLSTALPQFPYLETLLLPGNNMTILPESIQKCHSLRYLTLDNCKQLQEIRGMPPNLKVLGAIDCISLSVPSSSKLLSQDFHKAGDTEFTVPGARVPEWFAYKQISNSLSFWVRDKFPKKVALCFVFCSPHNSLTYDMLVSGNRHRTIYLPMTSSRKPHIRMVHFERGRYLNVPIGPGWNHVQFVESSKKSVEDERYDCAVSWMGLHIYEEEDGIENVRFTDPNSDKKILDYSVGTDNNHAIHLTKKCSVLDMPVLPFKYQSREDIRFWKEMWMMQAPIEVKFLMRKVLFDALPTGMNLCRRKVINNPFCPICEIEYETIKHVFMFCEWTRPVWFGSNLNWCIDSTELDPLERYFLASENALFILKFFELVSENILEREQAYVHKIMGIVGNICWAIWKGRNEYVVESKAVDPELALSRVKTLSEQYSRRYPLVQTAAETEREPRSNVETKKGETSDSIIMDTAIHNGQMIEDDNKVKGKSVLTESSSSNIKENRGQDGLSLVHNATFVKEQLTAEMKKGKRNRSRCSSGRPRKKPRLDRRKSTTKWKRNPMHLRLSRQLLQQYKPVFRKSS